MKRFAIKTQECDAWVEGVASLDNPVLEPIEREPSSIDLRPVKGTLIFTGDWTIPEPVRALIERLRRDWFRKHPQPRKPRLTYKTNKQYFK